MIWTKLKQKEIYLMNRSGDRVPDSAIYNGHLLVLGDAMRNEKTAPEPLCCWNPGICCLILK